MSFFENTRKPVGLGGKIMVAMMNFGHSAMAEWGLRFLQSRKLAKSNYLIPVSRRTSGKGSA